MKKQIIFINALLALAGSLILSTVAFAQVKTWGDNDYGQIGDGTWQNTRPSPTTISSLTDIIDINGGQNCSMAVRADGTVIDWGYNHSGQFGDGTKDNGRTYPSNPVPGLTNVIDISIGRQHSLVLKADGTVWASGNNSKGQIGNETTTESLVHVRVGVGVTGFSNIIAVDAGDYHNLALKSDGTVWAWGSNFYGQVGDGTGTDRLSPVQIASLSNNTLAVSAGSNYSMALTKTGQVYVWGANLHGQIGNGSSGFGKLTPTLNTNLSNVAQIQAGNEHGVALKTDGTVWSWGRNSNGQVGNGTTTTSGCECIPTPIQTATLTGITAIRAENSQHTLARRITGFIRAWGNNQYGQIGNGTAETTAPYAVSTPVSSTVGGGNVIFGTGDEHSLLSVPTVPTPPGTNVVVRLGDAYVRFDKVIFNNVNTIINAIDPNSTGMSVPAGLTIAANNQAYKIANTFTPGGNGVTVCINATNEFDETEFSKLRLLHGIDGTLVDRTVSRNYQKREICAAVSTISSSVSPFVLAKSLAPTAAQVSVSGRVSNQSGRGIAKAQVTVVSTDGVQRTVLTNSFGYYSVGEIGAGEFVIISVSAKGYLFEAAQFAGQAMDDLTEINFSGTRFGLPKQNF